MQNDLSMERLEHRRRSPLSHGWSRKSASFRESDFHAGYTWRAVFRDTGGKTSFGAALHQGHEGWEICPQLEALREAEAIDKVTFGSEKLGKLLQEENRKEQIEDITLVGLCTGHLCDLKCIVIESIFAGDTDYRGCILLCRGNAEKPRDSARRNAHVPDQHRKIKYAHAPDRHRR